MEINLDYKVDMSVNGMYAQRRQGKFLKREALNLRALIMRDVKYQIKETEKLELEDKQLSIAIGFTENWYYKNGEERKVDLDNRLKFLIDSVFKALELEDKMIFELYVKKEQSELKESVQIDIRELK